MKRLSETFAFHADARVFLLNRESVLDAFWASLAVVFAAELGDKTQLVALSLASRYKVRVVLAGILCATLCVHLLSVALGGAAGHLLPDNWVGFIAGVAFVGFGLWTLRGDELSDGDDCRKGRSPFWIVTITFFIAELGDKTMLSTMTMAAERSLFWTWIGSSLGMVLSDGLAILVGQVMGARLPERIVKTGAATLFLGFGAFKMLQSGVTLPVVVWPAGLFAIALTAWFMFRPQPRPADLDVDPSPRTAASIDGKR